MPSHRGARMTDKKKKKKNNYDYTSAQRGQRRVARIRAAGLSNIKVVAHKDDAAKVRAYAKKLYEKRGFLLEED